MYWKLTPTAEAISTNLPGVAESAVSRGLACRRAAGRSIDSPSKDRITRPRPPNVNIPWLKVILSGIPLSSDSSRKARLLFYRETWLLLKIGWEAWTRTRIARSRVAVSRLNPLQNSIFGGHWPHSGPFSSGGQGVVRLCFPRSAGTLPVAGTGAAPSWRAERP